MSFYTALTGLNGAQADISATSNNIANVGTTGFKRSRAEFGDIFATSPLQNASSSIGSGTILKGISQQFTQGNIASSLNALDLAISGQGFFALKPSLTASQTVYTRNGSLSVDNDRYVVDSAGQYLLVFPVNQDGSVTAKDIQSAQPLQLPVTAGEPRATSNIALGVNLPAGAPVIDKPFSINDPSSYTNSTSITIFDDLGNPTIATMYFVKTKNASVEDPTNRYDTRLVINGQTIEPDLVPSVSNDGKQIFIDRFGNQTTRVPDDNYFIEGKGSPLYRIDTLERTVPSQPAAVKGDSSAFDFGEEGDRFVEIVTDPVYFGSTFEGQIASGAGNPDRNTFWGRDFLLVNIDNSDQPVSIDIRPGRYNATQLAAEVERAINEAYGDDKKIQVRRGVDDTFAINFTKVNIDGTTSNLSAPIQIDLLGPSYVSAASTSLDRALEDVTPNLTREQLLAHAQARVNIGLNEYIYSNGALDDQKIKTLGLDQKLFARVAGQAMSEAPSSTKVASFKHTPQGGSLPATDNQHLVYSFADRRPQLAVFDNKASISAGNVAVEGNRLTITMAGNPNPGVGSSVMIGEKGNNLSGRELTVLASTANSFTLDISGISGVGTTDGLDILYGRSTSVEAFFEGSENRIAGVFQPYSTGRIILREIGDAATRDHASPPVAGVPAVVITPAVPAVPGVDAIPADPAKPASVTAPAGANGLAFAYDTQTGEFAVTGDATAGGTATVEINGQPVVFNYAANDDAERVAAAIGAAISAMNGDNGIEGVTITANSSSLTILGRPAVPAIPGVPEIPAVIGSPAVPGAITFDATGSAQALGLVGTLSASIGWVDERNPPIKVGYDTVNQRLQFTADRAVLGAGAAGFNSFRVFTNGIETGANGLGIPALGNSTEGLIRGGEVLSTGTFLANGQDIQLNDNRYGIRVVYNSDTQSFTIRSGTTGEEIPEDGALGVTVAQRASNVQVGRRQITSPTRATENVGLESVLPNIATIGGGSNALLGFGQSVQDAVVFTAPRGLAAEPARAVGDTAQAPLTDVFRLSADNNENVFNISVNGISGVVTVPPGNYVGTTLAQALQDRINQMDDPLTGRTVGGVTVRYSAVNNNFVFSTGTTGDGSTIKVRGAARLGLDDVPLGVGSVPEIFNLKQARSPEGLPLFVDADGNITTTPPESLVEGYYPLYINEGELTFDRTGKLMTPLNKVRYEDQSDGFSISLDVDFSASTQLAQPFTVLNINQDGFTSGRLDGLEIDSSGTIRANYTNGQNNPLGKIVIANFNNQNGLKQIGNATYVETAVSGAPQIGEAGAEGFGTILSGSLERSNVDITEELVNLITAQRNYQASAKAIETTTSLNQTIINIRQ
jgi:flagellar hook protein FlgE